MAPPIGLGETLLLLSYYFSLSLLACLGIHRVWLLAQRRLVRAAETAPSSPPEPWPPLLVQLPIYNEPAVAERLLRCCAALRYPAPLRIQVLDDSTDETTDVVARVLEDLRASCPGAQFNHVRRPDRTGFKAGALAEGLRRTSEPLVALFDADFQPPPDFLLRVVPHLLAGEDLGFVQARWDHLNRKESRLTRAQALLLDGHFLGEHAIRSARGLIFNFNGTAGIWRREAIKAAGGWEHDTLTEDIDLTYRARLQGWRGLFLPDTTAPAELPAGWDALLSQQRRWSRGTLQCARKLLPRLWRSDLPWTVKAEGTIPLLANLAWPLLAWLMITSFPVFFIRQHAGLYTLVWLDAALLFPATLAFFGFYYSISRQTQSVFASLGDTLLALCLGIALALNNATAAIRGLWGQTGAFVRTPKAGIGTGRPAQRNRGAKTPFRLEWLLFLHLSALFVFSLWLGVYSAVPFTLFFLAGVAWVVSGKR